MRFQSLDSFRGLCAISVVMYHMHVTGSVADLAFFRHADVFVEFFFVLSGFVLAYSYASKSRNINAPDFLIARTFRLVPLHWFMLAVFLILEVAKLVAYQKLGIVFNTLPFTGWSAPNEILPNLLLVHSWLFNANEKSFNYPSWSISVEYYLYVIFLATMFMPGKLRTMSWVVCATCALGILTGGNGLLKAEAARGLWCFFSGALSYWIFHGLHDRNRLPTIVFNFLEAASLITTILVVTVYGSQQQIYASVLYCAVVVIFAFDAGFISRFLRHKFFLLLGKLSYSIYMVHAAVLFCLTSAFLILQKYTGVALAPMIDGTRHLDTGNGLLNNVVVVSTLVLVIAISILTHRMIEVRGQKLGKSLISHRAKTLAAAQPLNP
jgi:peptidoglycan/LPS O-acetylase OafA/YrhL